MTKTRKHMHSTSPEKGTVSPVPRIMDVPLSPHWAFVVQCRAVPEGTVFETGRVEHLVSGRTNHFRSLKELSVYLERELRAAESPAKQ
jgi:hypothetical protein